jgi:hypothetical protein
MTASTTITHWPKPDELIGFYGDPRGKTGGASMTWESKNLVYVTPPWKLFTSWDGKPVTRFRIHKACAESLVRIFTGLWNFYGRQQELINRVGLSSFGGAYVFRTMRGSNKLSMHAYGCAVDFDPARNKLGAKFPAFGQEGNTVAAFESEGWTWGGHWKRPDGMHFEATTNL